jgi:hypothetical protein
MLNQNEGKTRQALVGAKPGKEPGVKNAATVGWFRECVHRSRNEIFSEIKTVTPAMAEVLLNQNHDNRNIRPVKLDQLISDMQNGRWAMNGEPLIFAKDGSLNDGQHRLMALVQAKVPLPMLFVFGVERETRTTVDQGATRSPGDYLHMGGVANGAIVAAIARLRISYEKADREVLGATNRITAAEIMERVKNDRTLATSATYANRHSARTKRMCTATVIGFCHNVLLAENATEGLAFMDMLCTGENISRTDPAFRAREKLMNIGRTSNAVRVEIIFRAWNAYREKRGMTTIPVHGRLPELV